MAGAFLYRCELRGADLSGAALRGAYLGSVSLIDTKLSATTLDGARFDNTLIASDLSEVIGLETVIHEGPLQLSVKTILRHTGQMPPIFLRGCGLAPDSQGLLQSNFEALTDAAYRVGRKAIQLLSCFISYSTTDKAFVDKLRQRLNESGVDYWYAPVHAVWGEGLREQIDRQIVLRDKVILVCSKASLNDSDWVKYEIEKSAEEERRRQKQPNNAWRLLFPIMLDDELLTWNHQMRPRLLDVLAGDFRNARGEAFEVSFRRLLHGLQRRP